MAKKPRGPLCDFVFLSKKIKFFKKFFKKPLTFEERVIIIGQVTGYGGIAQLARARGSYPRCRGFKSPFRYFFFFGPLVKRSRRGPLTAETRVRFPYGSMPVSSVKDEPKKIGSLAQLGERLPYKQDVIGSSPITPTSKGCRFRHPFFVVKKEWAVQLYG